MDRQLFQVGEVVIVQHPYNLKWKGRQGVVILAQEDTDFLSSREWGYKLSTDCEINEGRDTYWMQSSLRKHIPPTELAHSFDEMMNTTKELYKEVLGEKA